MKKFFFALILFVLSAIGVKGQDVAIKTNLLSDGFYNPSLGLEIGVAPRWSIDLYGQCNFWNLSHNRKWKHWIIQPEGRYWFCQNMDGHFIGAHIIAGSYNIGEISMPFSFLGTNFRNLKDNRYQGWMTGLGASYGYSWPLSKHFNIEAELGIGYIFSKYDIYECSECGRKIESGKNHNYVGLTKAAINVVYVF